MKRFLSMLLCLAMLFGMMPGMILLAGAETLETSGQCGENVYWEYDSLTATLTISGTGKMNDYAYRFNAPWIDLGYDESIRKVVIEEGVTSIGDWSFSLCYSLTDVEIANTVTSIGEYAFRCCGMSYIEIPRSVKEIESEAFVYCESLSTVVFEGNQPQLGLETFYDVHASVYYPAGDATWDREIYRDLGGRLKWIGYNAVNKPTYGFYAKPEIRDNLFWSFDETSGTLFITGSGRMYPYSEDTPWVQHKEDAIHLVVKDGVESISASAFAYFENLESVQLADSVKYIGPGAFEWCTGITSFEMGNGVAFIDSSAFGDCSNLVEIQLSESLCHLGENAFSGCACLVNITLPEGLKTVSRGAFSYCTGLTSVTFPSSLTYLDETLFWECKLSPYFTGDAPTFHEEAFRGLTGTAYYPEGNGTWTDDVLQRYGGKVSWESYSPDELPEYDPEGALASGDCGSDAHWSLSRDGVLTISGSGDVTATHWSGYASQIKKIVVEDGITSLVDSAFSNCENLKTAVIAESVTKLGSYLFRSCCALEEVNIPEGVREIPWAAFSDCESLTEIEIPKGVTTIRGEAFAGSGLIEVVLPDTVTAIGEDAFLNCYSLAKINIPDGVKEISEHTFNSTALKEIVLPEGLTEIDNHAFMNCEDLTSVTLPSTLQSISYGGFSYCTSLTELELPEGLTWIGYSALCKTALTELTMPSTLTSLDRWIFSGCEDLESITFTGDAPDFDERTFSSYTGTCYYPENNDTWTADVLQDYDGDITWVSYTLEKPDVPDDDEPDVDEPDDETIIASGTLSNVSWKLNDQGLLTLSGTGDMPHCEMQMDVPWLKYADEIKYAVIEEGLTSIAYYCFYECWNLVTAEIPDGVTRIEPHAFEGCISLNYITFPHGLKEIGLQAFYNCKNLETIGFIGSGLVSIGAHAFDMCRSLTAFDFPATVEYIGTYAFRSCDNLDTLIFSGDAPEMSANSFEGVNFANNEFGGNEAKAYYPADNKTWPDGCVSSRWIKWVSYTDEDDIGKEEKPAEEEVSRLAGSGRWATSLAVADQMKENLGLEKFDAIIIASGDNFADALAGSYLSAVKSAPILLCWNGGGRFEYLNQNILDYIDENLAEDGTVYILGGKGAVPMSFDEKLGDRVNRLNGSNRFETNLMILKEAGVKTGEEILVCTSTNFADSLSASATGKPILLVFNEGGKLFDNQKEYLATLSGNSFTILGGEGAVSEKMAGLIGAYGTTTRLAGASRFETSVMVAEKYFENPDSAVLAYAWNYPDGLCGGGLAYSMNAPLILTMTKYETRGAKDYIQGEGIQNAVVLGGSGLISDDCVRNIFGLTAEDTITTK